MPEETSQSALESYPKLAPKTQGRTLSLPEEGAPVAPPATDAPAPSAETQVPEQTPEQGTPPTTPSQVPEKSFHMPPEERWEALRRDREEARQRAERAEALAQAALSKLSTPQAPVEDHWKGLVDHPDPTTAQFYQQQRALFQKEAKQIADQQVQGILQTVDAGRRELTAIKIAQFRSANQDIKPGSPEEAEIAGFVQQGYDLETSKKLAFYDRLEAENRALKAKQSAVPSKVNANVHASAGIPETSGLPAPAGNWRDRAAEVIDKGGSLVDVANTLFGKRR